MQTLKIRFRCPSCRTKMDAAGEGRGTVASCPLCGARVRVPRGSFPARELCASLAGVLLIAAVAGAFLWRRPGAEAARPRLSASFLPATEAGKPATASPGAGDPEASESNGGDRSLAVLAEENRRLAEANARAAQKFSDLAAWVLANFRGKFPLPERLVPRLRVVPVTEDFALHGDIVELLRVTPQETGLVNDALAFTRGEMLAREAALMSVMEMRDDRVTIYVPPFEAEGQQLREDLYLALEATLGAPRFDRLVEVSEAALEEAYDYFGQASRTMTFELAAPAEPNQNPYLVIKDGWVIPDGVSKRTTRVSETAVVEIPKRYLGYLSWLPESLAQFAPR